MNYKPFQESSAKLPLGVRVKAQTRDLAGQKFGRLTCIEVVGKAASNSLLWRCVCDCGTELTRSSAKIVSKGISSCGCYLKEISRERFSGAPAWNKGTTYTNTPKGQSFSTRKSWSEAVRREKGSACENCGWCAATCDVHHITPRSMGGKNTVDNGTVLCPNCHRVAHESIAALTGIAA